ncbi:hypothetical protein [Priestia aryabhattai]
MIKRLFIFGSLVLILFGCSKDLPTYKLVKNKDSKIINGTEYAIQRLEYGDKIYASEPKQDIDPDYYKQFKLGNQIAKTTDGLKIYNIKNSKKRVALKGLMFPETFFKLEASDK